jgi:hypothetical protein
MKRPSRARMVVAQFEIGIWSTLRVVVLPVLREPYFGVRSVERWALCAIGRRGNGLLTPVYVWLR